LNDHFTAEQGGGDIQKALTPLLEASAKQDFKTSSSQEIVRDIKEKLCYVAMDAKEEKKKFDAEVLPDTPKENSYYSNPMGSHAHYELPDGQIIRIGAERFSVTESIFKPSLIGMKHDGIHDAVFKVLRQSDPNIQKVGGVFRRCFICLLLSPFLCLSRLN
jgi:actin-related protein